VIAVDTNVLVRLLTEDDPAQAAKARALFEAGAVFIATTVLLETEWVLRGLYKREPNVVIDALEALISLPNAQCQDEPALRQAIAWRRGGLDFADALHLATGRDAAQFATFDRALTRRAARAGASPPVVDLSAG
jgi:predicted nucleic-acid-binding protein